MASNTNPANAAMPYLQQVPGTITPYYQPYINSGNQALSTLMAQYNNLLSNPGGMVNQMGSGYTQSPGYEYQMTQGMNAANSAAAAGGMLGTPYHQEEASQTAEDIANQDYYNYLDHTMKLYGMGLEGEQGINQMGYGASNELAQSLGNNLISEGGLAYAGQSEQNRNQLANKSMQDQLWGSIIGGIGSLL